MSTGDVGAAERDCGLAPSKAPEDKSLPFG